MLCRRPRRRADSSPPTTALVRTARGMAHQQRGSLHLELVDDRTAATDEPGPTGVARPGISTSARRLRAQVDHHVGVVVETGRRRVRGRAASDWATDVTATTGRPRRRAHRHLDRVGAQPAGAEHDHGVGWTARRSGGTRATSRSGEHLLDRDAAVPGAEQVHQTIAGDGIGADRRVSAMPPTCVAQTLSSTAVAARTTSRALTSSCLDNRGNVQSAPSSRQRIATATSSSSCAGASTPPSLATCCPPRPSCAHASASAA